MRYPVLVNINVNTVLPDGNHQTDINRAVLDFHYSNVHSFVNGPEGNCVVSLKDTGRDYNIQLTFQEFYDLYTIQNPIDEQFKDDVDAYAAENLKGLKEFLRKQNARK